MHVDPQTIGEGAQGDPGVPESEGSGTASLGEQLSQVCNRILDGAYPGAFEADGTRVRGLFDMRDEAVAAPNKRRYSDPGDVGGPLRKADGCDAVPGELANEAMIARTLPARAASTTCVDNGAGICTSCATVHQIVPGEVVIAPREPRALSFDVLGIPAPKGSGRAILIAGKARHVPSGSNANRDALKSWDVALREAARAAVGDIEAPPLLGKAVMLALEFRMRRPSGHYNKKTGKLKPSAPKYPTTKPDSSKLLRSTEDALNGIVWGDDSNIVDHVISKRYAVPGQEGARIVVREAT